MALSDHLLQLARQVVESVVNQVTQQVNVIGNQVNDPVEAILREILSGIWEGDDADAFVEEVRTRVLSELAEILQIVNNINLNVTSAAQIIEQADQQVEAMIEDLGATLGQVS